MTRKQHYARFGWPEGSDLPYVWPVKSDGQGGLSFNLELAELTAPDTRPWRTR